MRTLPLAAVVLAAALAAGCELEPEAAPAPPPVTVTETAPAPPAKSGPTAPTPTPTPAVAKKVRVPRVIGMNHQDAQNKMQAVGLFTLVEEDATGQNRLLLWDRNWIVVKQSPRAGKVVTEDATITLYSKKIDE